MDGVKLRRNCVRSSRILDGTMAMCRSLDMCHPTPTPLSLCASRMMVGRFPSVVLGNRCRAFVMSAVVSVIVGCWRILNLSMLFLPPMFRKQVS